MIRILNFSVLLSFFLCLHEQECVPLPYPQYTYYDGYQTGVAAGTHYKDPHYDDCYEASVHGGLAANSQIGTDLKLAGIHSGGLRCKQGIGASLRAGAGPLQGSLSSDTSVHLADTKVEANLFKNQIAGNYGGVVGASYATGAGIDIGYDKRQRNIGTDITTPIGMFGGHVGCITEVCIGACVNVRVC